MSLMSELLEEYGYCFLTSDGHCSPLEKQLFPVMDSAENTELHQMATGQPLPWCSGASHLKSISMS
jgi:hypothetical protein